MSNENRSSKRSFAVKKDRHNFGDALKEIAGSEGFHPAGFKPNRKFGDSYMFRSAAGGTISIRVAPDGSFRTESDAGKKIVETYQANAA